MPRWYTAVGRRAFKEAACSAIKGAVQGCKDDRKRRAAERWGIFESMERFGLIEPTRGGSKLAIAERQY